MIQPNQYKNVLLLSPVYVKQVSIIGEEVNEDTIRVAVRKVQDVDLQKVLGSNLLRKLQELIGTNAVASEGNEHYKMLLDEYIAPYMREMVVADISFDLGYKWRNKGIITTNDEYIANTPFGDIARLVDKHKVTAEAYRTYLCKFLCTNGANYPELNCSCDGGLEPSRIKPADPTPFYLG